MAKIGYEIWLIRAQSNLQLAKTGKKKDIVYEDLCFEAQQSAEKALKALLIYFRGNFPKVHSFNVLLNHLQKHVGIPKYIQDVLELSDYAVQARYPGDYFPVTKEEYKKAVKISQKILLWVKKTIKEEQKYIRQ